MFESIYTHVHMETHLDHMSFRKTERERERETDREREREREPHIFCCSKRILIVMPYLSHRWLGWWESLTS